ncbi:MAG: enoyl-CoA hydratase-related protein [Archaeoglobaceae archaeon]|nr:enoyl-CoA hydratase-related protein [Archaeoglobaceae archaeon]MDW7989861.1 enoyl-CoA hydratase-related protein [Archaeoglobaceae archaeon]
MRVIYEEKGKVGKLILNNPEKINPLSLETLKNLEQLIRKIAEERKVNTIVLAGAGKNFSSGHDLREILEKDAIDVEKLFLQCFKVMNAIRNAPQIYIAMVRGVAYAAGCQLVAACDLAIASERSKFATPGVNIGLFCFTPITFVSRNVNRKKAFELGFLGEPIDAEEALKIGLVNKVVKDEVLEIETEEFAKKIARFPLEVLESGKRFFYTQIFMEDFSALQYATETIALHSTSQFAKEGIEAFLEKRKPKWGD